MGEKGNPNNNSICFLGIACLQDWKFKLPWWQAPMFPTAEEQPQQNQSP